jgi:hypothetical protein
MALTLGSAIRGSKISSALFNAMRLAVLSHDTALAAKIGGQIIHTGAGATGTLGTGGTYSDVPGCTVTFTTTHTNAQAFVFANFDASTGTITTAQTLDCTINVDTVDNARSARWSLPNNGAWSGVRLPLVWTGQFTLATAGSHTLKMRAKKDGGTWVWNINNTNSTIEVVVFDLG